MFLFKLDKGFHVFALRTLLSSAVTISVLIRVRCTSNKKVVNYNVLICFLSANSCARNGLYALKASLDIFPFSISFLATHPKLEALA